MVWAPLPAPRALSVLQAEIGSYILAPSDSTVDSQSLNGLNDGIRRLNTRTRWPWLLVSESITLVAGTADYELATGATKKVRTVYVTDSAGLEKGVLSFLDPKTFADRYPDRTATGSVECYTARNIIADGKINLAPTPDAGFLSMYPKLKVFVLKRLIYYSAAGDTLTTLGGGAPEVEDFLVWHAKGFVAAIYDPAKAAYANDRAEMHWQALIRDSNEEVDWE